MAVKPDDGEKIYKKALQLAKKKNDNSAEVLKLLSKAEALGHAKATYALATWYLHGEHTKKDLKKAVVLLKRATKRGDPDAAYDLAVWHELIDTSADKLRAAFENYLLCATRYATKLIGEDDMYSFAEAAHELARCYYHGFGVQADRTLAKIWQKAARG